MTGPTVHLVTGSTGAGKTTYSQLPAERADAVRFSIDEWMIALFGPDITQPLDQNWIWERAARCDARILATALQVAARGTSVVLDLAFTTAAQRAAAAAKAAESGLEVALHWLDIDPAERWRRVSGRNLEKGESFAFAVTRQMFDYVETRYQPPSVEEMLELNGSRIEQ